MTNPAYVDGASLNWRRSASCSGGTCVEVARTDDGWTYVRASEEPDSWLCFTPDEWTAFVKGVEAGEFNHFGGGS